MTLEEALEQAATGNSVLFLGAGFSVDAVNTRDAKFKPGRLLAKHLAALTDLPDDTPLQDAADMFLDKFGADELIKLLKLEYVAKHVTEDHETVSRIPWKRVYTTNYDNVFELAATNAGKIVVPVDTDTNIYHTPKADTLCVHLNGFITGLNRDNIRKSFKLTDTSYASATLEHSPWAALFRQDTRFAHSVFFIGYSLYDLDIKRILYESPELQQKTFFILHDAVDTVTIARASKYGTVLKIGLAGYAKIIAEGGFLTPRKAGSLEIGRSVVEYHPPIKTRVPTDREFLDLMMLGEFRPELSDTTSASGNAYVCERVAAKTIAEQIDSGQARAVAIHSDIANGKTMVLAVLANEAAVRGWRIFMTSELSEYAATELSKVAALPGKILLLIDNYVDWLDQLSGITAVAGDRLAIVVSARSNSHDLAMEDLEGYLSPLPVVEYDVNFLESKELSWWLDILDTYGLWGDLAGRSREHKLRYLSEYCERRTQAVLLKVLESPQVAKRLSDAASVIRGDPLVEKVAITAFALSILNQLPTMDTVVDLLGVDTLRNDKVRLNEGLTQFVDVSRYSIRVRSTVVAEYLLNHFWDAGTVVEVVLQMAHAADQLYGVSMKYENLFKTLVRFSSIQQVLPEKGKREAVVSYYEKLKLVTRCQRYPLFWLQYAIGAIVIGDLDRAKKYFDTSYSLAAERGWDTFQIDNHYARYLLVRAAEDAPFAEAMRLFRDARTLINRQIRSDKLHYPYRVASTYQRVFDRFQSQFSDDSLREIAEAARTVYDRIKELPAYRATNRHVVRCQESMRYIMDVVTKKLGGHA